jgi:hypothetical protein
MSSSSRRCAAFPESSLLRESLPNWAIQRIASVNTLPAAADSMRPLPSISKRRLNFRHSSYRRCSVKLPGDTVMRRFRPPCVQFLDEQPCQYRFAGGGVVRYSGAAGARAVPDAQPKSGGAMAQSPKYAPPDTGRRYGRG